MRTKGFVLLEKDREGGRAVGWSPGYGSVIDLKDQYGPPRQCCCQNPFSPWSCLSLELDGLCAEPEHTYLSTNFLATLEFEI